MLLSYTLNMETIAVHIKQEMRRLIIESRDAMSEDQRGAASEAICKKLERQFDGIAPGSICALYAPMGSEVDVRGFAEWLYAQGVRVAFPCMNAKGAFPRMHMREVSHEAWAGGAVPFIVKPIKRFAENEAALAQFPVVDPTSIDAIVVPMVAFDSGFNRLGYGGGNYDEYLALVSRETKVVGVAFEAQRVPHVPTEPHDLPLPRIVSA